MRFTPLLSSLSRRRFVQSAGVAGFGLVAACRGLPGQAQPPGPYRVARLGPPEGDEPFLAGLRDLGYVEGQNIVVEFRSSLGSDEALQRRASELLTWQPDVFVTGGTIATRAVMAATETLPIVFVQVNDPVRQGLVASLARPGGHVTGLSQLSSQLSTKQIELLREVIPGLARVGVFVNAANPANVLDWSQIHDAAGVLGVEARRLDLRAVAELEPALADADEWDAEGLILVADPFLTRQASTVAVFGLQRRVPVVAAYRAAAVAGALWAYGPNAQGQYRRAAYYVDRILKGTKPADLPVEQPTTFEFVINLKTAQALGLTIPQHVLLQATEVIQ